MKTIFDFNFFNEIALLRVDFNVPQDVNLNIIDNTRILSIKPTIDKILFDQGSIVLISHLGRPKGKFSKKYSFASIVEEISSLLNISLKFIANCIGNDVDYAVDQLKPGDVLLLENLRFFPEEEKGDIFFAKKLSKYGTIYVNDAFSVSHRNHASIVGITNFFQKKCFGILMEKELKAINKILYINKFSDINNSPVTVILGGNKISTKVTIINNLLSIIDNLIIGGGMAYTFIKFLGGKIGNSLFEDGFVNIIQDILDKSKKYKVKIYLPIDVIISNMINEYGIIKVSSIKNIPDNFFGLDIGSESIKLFTDVILNSKTILWNGPLGLFEISKFSYGTKLIASAIVKATQLGSFSLVGGGDSLSFIKQYNFYNDFSYVSTGGGAMLESLKGELLPGVKAILK